MITRGGNVRAKETKYPPPFPTTRSDRRTSRASWRRRGALGEFALAWRVSLRGAIKTSLFVSLLALLYGDGEKPMETGAKEDPSAPPRKPTCSCNKKPCGCQKAEINYAFLHSSGNYPAWVGGGETAIGLPYILGSLVIRPPPQKSKVLNA